MNDLIKTKGEVEIILDYTDGRQERMCVQNTVLHKGREALVKCLANDIGDSFEFYIRYMVFGDQGTSGGVPKYVTAARSALFSGAPVISKSVLSVIDPNNTSQVIFSAVLTADEAVGVTLNEMGLAMNSETGGNHDLYSMTTFPDLNKTSDLQITWAWRVSMV